MQLKSSILYLQSATRVACPGPRGRRGLHRIHARSHLATRDLLVTSVGRDRARPVRLSAAAEDAVVVRVKSMVILHFAAVRPCTTGPAGTNAGQVGKSVFNAPAVSTGREFSGGLGHQVGASATRSHRDVAKPEDSKTHRKKTCDGAADGNMQNTISRR